MTSATRASSAVSMRYAAALIDLAESSKSLDKVESDLSALWSMIGYSVDLAHMIRSPLVGRAQAEKALMALAAKAKFHQLTSNFLGTLCRNGRLNALEPIIEAFYVETARRRGEVTVNVQSAQDLTEKQVRALQDALSKGLGRPVAVRASVEPSILGGLVVTVGSQMIDDSVARKLERLKAAMSRQSNQNFKSKIEEVG